MATGSVSATPSFDLIDDEQAFVAEPRREERGVVEGTARFEADRGQRLRRLGQLQDLTPGRILDLGRIGDHAERDLAGREALPELAPALSPAPALFEDGPEVDPEIGRRGSRRLGLLEVEVPVGPQEEILDERLGVGPERLHELLLGEEALADEDLAEAPGVGLLAEKGGEERLLGDETVPDERLPEGFPGVVRARPLQPSFPEREALASGEPGHHEDSRPPAGLDPGEEIEEVEGGEVSGEAHGFRARG